MRQNRTRITTKISLFIGLLLLSILIVVGCGAKASRSLDVEKITYICYVGDQARVNMFVLTSDLKLLAYEIDDWYDIDDLFAGKLPPENEYRRTKRQLTEDHWNAIIDVLTKVQFIKLNEDISYEGAYDASSEYIQIETAEGVHTSGGYAVRYGNKRYHKRFKEVLSVLEPIVWESAPAEDTQESAGEEAASEESLTQPLVQEDAYTVQASKTASINPDGDTLETRFLPPEGFSRTPEDRDSFANFVRTYPMKEDGSQVLLHNGKVKSKLVHAAVFAMPIEDVDLQQCADSVMRMYAEYYYQAGQTERIAFHFTNGDLCAYETWRKDTAAEESYNTFVRYLHTVFNYAGTLSMSKECTPISEDDLSIGDVFIKGGSPGHVVMVVDTCTDETGRKAFLLAQGYMPAQEFHVLQNPFSESPWYYVDEITYPFHTPEYVFDEGSLMRPVY